MGNLPARQNKLKKRRKQNRKRRNETDRRRGDNYETTRIQSPGTHVLRLMHNTGKPQVLKHAINFKVFNYLSESISAEEVAKKLDTKPAPTSRLLDMLVILGMVRKRDGRYFNTPLAEEYLMEGKPTYMGDMYTMSVDMYEGMIAQIPQALKSDIPKMAPEQMFSEDYWAHITDMVARFQRGM